MKKAVCMLLLFCMVLSMSIVSVSATGGYDLNSRGRVTVTVEVPEDFDEVVFLSLMDTYGSSQVFPVLPESNYILVENVFCGFYLVSAHVDNDPRMEYIVLRDVDEITVSQEQDVFIKLTVTGGPQEVPVTDPPATEPPVTEPPVTEPPATEPSATEPTVIEPPATEVDVTVSTDTTEPTTPAATTTPQTDPQDTEIPSEPLSDPAEGTEEAPDPAGEKEDTPIWLHILSTLLSSAAFVGIVFGGAYIYRKMEGRE